MGGIAQGPVRTMGRTSAAEPLDAVVAAWVVCRSIRLAEAFVEATDVRSLESAGRAAAVVHIAEQAQVFRSIVLDGVAPRTLATVYRGGAALVVIKPGRSVVTWSRVDRKMAPGKMSRRYCEIARAAVSAYGTSHVA